VASATPGRLCFSYFLAILYRHVYASGRERGSRKHAAQMKAPADEEWQGSDRAGNRPDPMHLSAVPSAACNRRNSTPKSPPAKRASGKPARLRPWYRQYAKLIPAHNQGLYDLPSAEVIIHYELKGLSLKLRTTQLKETGLEHTL
jgi:hypothetical protein